MTKKALVALKESIQHWERLVSGDRLIGEIPNGEHCSLCTSFYNTSLIVGDADSLCVGCPIKDHTGTSVCFNTPYREVLDTITDYSARQLNKKKFKKAAEAELEFLKSLLPTK